MNENTPSSVQWNDNPNGTVTFATDVVALKYLPQA